MLQLADYDSGMESHAVGEISYRFSDLRPWEYS